jgi:hypothetical protein
MTGGTTGARDVPARSTSDRVAVGMPTCCGPGRRHKSPLSPKAGNVFSAPLINTHFQVGVATAEQYEPFQRFLAHVDSDRTLSSRSRPRAHGRL